MATIKQILKNTFGVKTLSPTDPGIIKLSQIRTGTYTGIGPVTITPTQEVAQLLGQAPDLLAQRAIASKGTGLGADISNFLAPTFKPLVAALGVGIAADFLVPPTTATKLGGLPPWVSSTLSSTQVHRYSTQALTQLRTFLVALVRQRRLAPTSAISIYRRLAGI